MRIARTAAATLVVLLTVLSGAAPAHAGDPSSRTTTPIQHFIYLMQGDRTFDNYFGTYPGADGIPKDACQPLAVDSVGSGCVKPFPLHGKTPPLLDSGKTIIDAQLHGGKLDGFVAAYAAQGRDGTSAMGYYDNQDLQYYWNVADKYVLFDKFFAAAPYGYRTNRSYWVSGAPQPGGTDKVAAGGYGDQPTIFDRLEAAGVSWKFYVQDYRPQETFRAASDADPVAQTVRVPLLNYARFVDDPKLHGHIVDLDQYYQDLADGTLPAVAYVASSGSSERSARSIPAGQDLVRNMTTQLMVSKFWDSSAFMLSYDGSGGWYDHVAPPPGNGLRVPALLVSPYAHQGQVNHKSLDYTSALRFIEQNWSVPALTARDAAATSLASAFDFRGPPRNPEIVTADGPAKDHPPLVKVAIIYWFYGGVAILVLMIIAGAAWRSVVRPTRPVGRARPSPPAQKPPETTAEPTQTRTEVPVP
jgi:phospholipase C